MDKYVESVEKSNTWAVVENSKAPPKPLKIGLFKAAENTRSTKFESLFRQIHNKFTNHLAKTENKNFGDQYERSGNDK